MSTENGNGNEPSRKPRKNRLSMKEVLLLLLIAALAGIADQLRKCASSEPSVEPNVELAARSGASSDEPRASDERAEEHSAIYSASSGR